MNKKYIIHTRMKTKTISGNVNLPYGTECECRYNMIYYNNKPLCYTTSQNAYDYFSCNDDKQGLTRGKLVNEIKKLLAKADDKHQARWDKLWEDISIHKYRRKEIDDYWLWNYDFYNAPINDLKYILRKIKEVK